MSQLDIYTLEEMARRFESHSDTRTAYQMTKRWIVNAKLGYQTPSNPPPVYIKHPTKEMTVKEILSATFGGIAFFGTIYCLILILHGFGVWN